MALLKPEEITNALKTLDGWTLEGKAIRKQFTFQDFPEAVLFVSALVPGAEDADHHPDIEIHYKRVILSYSTHDAGGLTAEGLRRCGDGRSHRRKPAAPRRIRRRLGHRLDTD